MTDEIFNVMKFFSGSYINRCGELIISDRGNYTFRYGLWCLQSALTYEFKPKYGKIIVK